MRIHRKLIKNNQKSRVKDPDLSTPLKLVIPERISVPEPVSVPLEPSDNLSFFMKVKDYPHNETIYPDVVSCVLRDRLGNNLFEIATTIGLALQMNSIPVFESWAYSEFFDWDLTFDSELERSIPWSIYVEKCFAYHHIPQCKNIKINGHFQSYKYFPENVILGKFKMKPNIHDYIMNKYENLLRSRTTSIHVRKGDYVNNWNYHNIRIDYYKRAIELMNKETDSFLVFSDDIEWCKTIMNLPKVNFIEGEPDYIDLFMMSLCTHNIITNSTFSWWGAFLNNKDGKKIIAPNKWFGKGLAHHDWKDLIPPAWTQIDC